MVDEQNAQGGHIFQHFRLPNPVNQFDPDREAVDQKVQAIVDERWRWPRLFAICVPSPVRNTLEFPGPLHLHH
jgi:hypothetical protein